ncbi:MAG: ThuA domain-containing protein [Thermoguttaceae bacterium]|nr:ThuA domain-containing protein [Planctomycetaceae bacterium]MBQ4143253.1 ThuA domain-containing protein [Thermoguttaceae bacterium]
MKFFGKRTIFERMVFRTLQFSGALLFFWSVLSVCFAEMAVPLAESSENAPKEDTRPLAAIIVSDDHYHADTLFPELAEWLESNYPIRTVVIHGHGGADFTNMQELRQADVVLLYIRRIALKNEDMKEFQDFLKQGKPLMAFRTASHAFSLSFDGKKKPTEGFCEWREFDAQVLGGNYHNHGPNDRGTRVSTLEIAKTHPIFDGVDTQPWHSAGSLYFTLPIAENAQLFQVGTVMGRTEPLTWLRKNEWGGEVFYTALGHWEDFEEERFRKMTANVILYLCRDKQERE